MAAILGYIHIIWLMLCSTLQVPFTQELDTNGTSAENFSCAVRSYTFKGPSMNCTWKSGKKALKDTQYFLYLKYHMEEEIECPHYIHDKLGRHIGCYFANVTVNQDTVNLTVTGSSKELPIQPSVHILQLYEHENLGPPRSFTWECQEQLPYCRVEWKPPPSSMNVPETCFSYQIRDEIRNTTDDIHEGVSNKNYSKDARYRLRIRTGDKIRCEVAEKFGEWSESIEFGTNPNPFPTKPFIFVVIGTIIVTLALVLACERSHAWKKCKTPIPQPKDFIKQCEKNMEKACIDPLPAIAEDEQITLVEEMTVGKEV